jgi:hypothetical protein
MTQADFLDLAAFFTGAFRPAGVGAGFSFCPMLARKASEDGTREAWPG